MNKEESQVRNPEKRLAVPENIFKDRGQTGIQTRHSVEAGCKPEEKKEFGTSQWL